MNAAPEPGASISGIARRVPVPRIWGPTSTPELEAAAPVDFDRVVASGATNGGFQMLGPPPFAR